MYNLEVTFLLAVPVDKKRRNAEEEKDETYHPESSDNGSAEEDEIEEEEEAQESGDETDNVSYDEEELPTPAKTLKFVAEQIKTNQKKAAKRKIPQKAVTGGKKIRKESNQTEGKKTKQRDSTNRKEGDRKEKTAKPTTKIHPVDDVNDDTGSVDGKDGKTNDRDGKKEKKVVVYNDKNVDFNLYNEAPEHIKNVKIKISSNILLMCRMIEAGGSSSKGLSYDYAAMSFVRNSKDGKNPFEFNLPLSLAPNILKGIQLLVKNNPKFFEKQLQTVNVD